MKTKQLVLLLLSAALFACGSEAPVDQDPQAPIQFSGDISLQSKATDNGFQSGDQMGVYITKWNGSSSTPLKSSGNYAENQLYTYSGSGFSSSPTLYYPSDGSKIDVYAYYPRVTTVASPEVVFTIKANQSLAGEYTKSDFMTAKVTGRSSSTSPIPLVFTHAMAKVVINLDPATVPSGAVSVKIHNAYNGLNYNLSNGSFNKSGTRSEITLCPNGTNSFMAIIPPQTFAANELFATITVNGQNYIWKPTYQLDFTQNVETGYTLTLEPTGNIISFTATINPWGKPKINEIVPPDLLAKLRPHMPIYNGTTPPLVNGTYLCNPSVMTYSSIDGDMDEGYNFADMLFRFLNQNTANNTLDYEEKQGEAQSSGKGYFISGSGVNFTVFFNITGTSYGIHIKTATVISGTKSGSGISNYRYAFLLLEKGADPDDKLVDVGTIRVFKDGNELASNANWSNVSKSTGSTKGHSMLDMWRR